MYNSTEAEGKGVRMSRIVIALGGNALGNDAESQQQRIEEACPALVGLIERGYEIIITHGNGPQVGMIENAFGDKMPLPECTAMSQGYIGYHLQKGLLKELRRRGMPWQVATVVTQVEVSPDDPAFYNPSKPIGAFFTKAEAEAMMSKDNRLMMREDSGRGYRKCVASPKPVDIVEKKSILNLLDNEYIVIACGGGGVPVIRAEEGDYRGVDAVIDKDFAAAKLAELLGADYLFILTAVEYVSVNFGKEDEKQLKSIIADEAERLAKNGEFGAGSMLPKVEAAISFVRSGTGREAVIASLEMAPQAVDGRSGTIIKA